VDCEPPQPLTPEQFNDLLNAVELFCASARGYVYEKAAEFRALFLLQRWQACGSSTPSSCAGAIT